MKHKRRGPKSTRSGCLFCKPWKHQGTQLKNRQKPSVLKHLWSVKEAQHES